MLSLLCGVTLAATPKVIVNTNTMTTTYFKPEGSDKQVGGGYSASSTAEGQGHVGLEFQTNADFRLMNNQFVSIDTGVHSTATGATWFGIATGLNQWLPTANGYRGKEFNIHFYTFVPEPSIIDELATGHLSKDQGDARISHTVTTGGKTFTVGTDASLSGDQVNQNDNNVDSNALSTQGFGQDTGYDVINEVHEGGISCTGIVSSDQTTLIT